MKENYLGTQRKSQEYLEIQKANKPMLELMFYVLMVASTPTDADTENYTIPLGIYTSAEECAEAAFWIDEHGNALPRHLYCMPLVMEN